MKTSSLILFLFLPCLVQAQGKANNVSGDPNYFSRGLRFLKSRIKDLMKFPVLLPAKKILSFSGRKMIAAINRRYILWIESEDKTDRQTQRNYQSRLGGYCCWPRTGGR